MSLILDALNKADRENRQPDSSPSLDTEHELPDSDDLEKGSNHKLIFSVALIAIILGASIFWLISDSNNETLGGSEKKLVSNEVSSSQKNKVNGNINSKTNKKTSTDTTKKASQSQEINISQIEKDKKLSRSEELRKRYIEAQYEEQKKRISGANIPNTAELSNQDSTISSASNKANQPTTKNRQISGLYQTTEATQRVSSTKAANQTNEPEINTDEQNRIIDQLASASAPSRSKSSKKARTTERDMELAIREFQNAEKSRASPPGTASEPELTDDTLMSYYTDIGSIRDLPFSAQEKIPSIMYSNHQYSGSRKSVEMNGKQYRENSKVSSDLTIEKILKDGVILRYKDHKFKMSAYNNWINL